jgi:hypothetical protein
MHGKGKRLHLASLEEVFLLAGCERGHDGGEVSHLLGTIERESGGRRATSRTPSARSAVERGYYEAHMVIDVRKRLSVASGWTYSGVT